MHAPFLRHGRSLVRRSKLMASPDAFHKFVAKEFHRWDKLVKEQTIVAY